MTASTATNAPNQCRITEAGIITATATAKITHGRFTQQNTYISTDEARHKNASFTSIHPVVRYKPMLPSNIIAVVAVTAGLLPSGVAIREAVIAVKIIESKVASILPAI